MIKIYNIFTQPTLNPSIHCKIVENLPIILLLQGTHSASKISTPRGVMKSSLHSHHVGSGTLPVFNSRTGLPISSSPVSEKFVFFWLLQKMQNIAQTMEQLKMTCNAKRLIQYGITRIIIILMYFLVTFFRLLFAVLQLIGTLMMTAVH